MKRRRQWKIEKEIGKEGKVKNVREKEKVQGNGEEHGK